jgi:NitT/TauT family transport system substrate-binding protein
MTYASSVSRFLKSAAIALASSTLLTPFAVSAAPVKVGVVTWIGYGPLYIADKLGTFKKYGVDVKLVKFQDPALIPPAIESNALEGGTLTYDEVIGVTAKGWKHPAVLTLDYSNGADAIVVDSSIKSVKDFKGKKVAFNPLSPSDFLLSYALQKNNMTQKDIQPANMSPEAVPATLISGAAPIGVTYEPSVSQILSVKSQRTFKVIFSSKDAPGLITDVLSFKKDYISKHPKEVKAIIQAYLDSLDYMKKNPKEANAIIGKWMDLSAKEVQTQLPGVFNPGLKEMMSNFTKSDKIDSFYKSGPLISDVLIRKKQISKGPNIEETMDTQFLTELLKTPPVSAKP